MSLRLEEVSCNLCGVDRCRTVFERPYDLGSLDGRAAFAATTDEFGGYGRIVRCLSCGLVYTNPRPGAGHLREGYAESVDEPYLAESSSRSINAHLSLNNIKRFVRAGRLLEVGSSTGYFLNAARADFEVLGLEPSQWACAIARERFKLEVYSETLEETRRPPPGGLDALVMIDVLEHLPDPRRAAARAAELLRPGGILYLVTPDIDSLSARVLGGYWWGLRPAHIYYFGGRTLGRLLAETGFEVVLSKSFGRIFSYGYWASRMRHYPRWVYGGLRAAIGAVDIEDKLLYLDTRDSIEVCARRRA